MRRARASRYLGVWWESARERWAAGVYQHHRMLRIAHFEEEEAAAIARDRVVVYVHGPAAERNFPRRRLIAASIQGIRRELRARAKAKKTSRWNGVYRRRKGDRPWCAEARVEGRLTDVGNWPTEERAAKAHDRAILFYNCDLERLNFPKIARRLRPASVRQLRAEAERLRKSATSSRYRGVSWSKNVTCWRARITYDGVLHHIGLFDDEDDAARAYDAAAKRAFGTRARLNFPTSRR